MRSPRSNAIREHRRIASYQIDFRGQGFRCGAGNMDSKREMQNPYSFLLRRLIR